MILLKMTLDGFRRQTVNRYASARQVVCNLELWTMSFIRGFAFMRYINPRLTLTLTLTLTMWTWQWAVIAGFIKICPCIPYWSIANSQNMTLTERKHSVPDVAIPALLLLLLEAAMRLFSSMIHCCLSML